METRTLTYFVAVADHGSLLAASSVVNITQPALSRALHQLERQLGVALFRKPGRRLELTAAGREFLPVARDLIDRAAAARRLGETLALGRLARVTIAAPTTTLTDVIAPFLATLRPDDPIPTIREAGHREALHGLERDTDLAILTRRPPREFASMAVAALPVLAQVPPGHRWAGRASITLTELVTSDLVVLDPGYRARQILDEALVRHDLAAPIAVECGHPHVAQAMAAAGRGVAVVSDDPRFGLHGLTVTTATGPLTMRLVAAWRRDHHAAPTLAELAERLKTFVAARYAA